MSEREQQLIDDLVRRFEALKQERREALERINEIEQWARDKYFKPIGQLTSSFRSAK